MKNKIAALIAVGMITVGGLFVVGCNNDSIKDEMDSKKTSGTSPMVTEQLAVVGNITEIDNYEEGIIIKVVVGSDKDANHEEVYVKVHANAIIGHENKEDLLEISDLKEGQNIKVYHDGIEVENTDGQISALKVLIVEE